MSDTIGWTNGCFDLFHAGHHHLLRCCAARCDWLIVALNSDRSVRELKGEGRPVDDLHRRMDNVWKTGQARQIVSFDNEAHLMQLIAATRPHVIFKGAEYADKWVVGTYNARVELIPMLPGWSTTSEIARRQA